MYLTPKISSLDETDAIFSAGRKGINFVPPELGSIPRRKRSSIIIMEITLSFDVVNSNSSRTTISKSGNVVRSMSQFILTAVHVLLFLSPLLIFTLSTSPTSSSLLAPFTRNKVLC